MKFLLALLLGVNQAVLGAQLKPCCALLKSHYPEQLSVPSDESFATALNGFWSGQEREVRPACIFRPTLAEELVKIVDFAHNGCNIAIRGGGHTPFPGAANVENGVLIDMSGFDEILVNEERTITRIGAGQKWVNVYRKLDAMGLAVTGGRVASVGLAGLILGGGMSFYSPQHGFVCDNVVDYDFVLPNGTITNVNATSHPSLFRALKGGSNNFGIITSFSLRTFPQPAQSLWGGNILYAPKNDTLASHLKAFTGLATAAEPDPHAAVTLNFAYSARVKAVFVMYNLAYTKREVDPAALRPFLAIDGKIYDTLRFSNMSDMVLEMEASVAAHGARSIFATLTISPSAALLSRIHAIFQSALARISAFPGISWSLSLQPISSSMISNPNNDYGKGNVLGLTADDGNMVNILLTASYDSRDHDAVVDRQARRFVREARQAAEEAGGLKDWVYLNYAAPWQDPITSYGRENKEFMQNVSKQYDPHGIFQRRVPGGFKLFPKDTEEGQEQPWVVHDGMTEMSEQHSEL